ncbi:MAG: cyclic nucleotide-binding domain-containing protein [Anaerolineae bacterium]|nr:cyclic nucleotide-binding domain-containing protein [Anaerolineae bacterium]
MAADSEAFWKAVETATDPTAYRPARHTAVTATRLSNRDETYYVLKQPERKNYVRLSEADFALWWQMDGRRRIKDLLFYSLKRYKSLPVGHFTTVVTELRQGGFLQDAPVNLYDQIESQLQARAPESRGRRLLKGFLHTEIARSGLDPLFTRLYGWARPLFHPIAQIFLLLLILSGGALFALLYNRHVYTLTSSGYAAALSLIAANLIVIGLHEVAHALTTKHIGRDLDRGGFLLYWGLPAFFVDTRDTWLATSRQRILVSWAGPYSGLLLGGLLGWALTAVAYFLPADTADTIWATFLYQIAFLAYFSVFINLNPLLELDGYFILMDWLEIPGLRSRAFRFWREDLWGKVKASASPRQLWRELRSRQRLYLLFGALAFLYSVFALWLAVNFWRLRLVPFAENLWAGGFWGRVTLVLLTAVTLIPTAYFLGLLLWNRLQAGLRWLAHRNLLARPDVLALLTGVPIFVGLPLLWLLLGRLPAGAIWQPVFVWLLYSSTAVALAFVARQLTGSRFQWALWALAAAPLALSLAYLASGLATTVWRDLALMLAATAVLASGIVAWFTINPRWLARADRWLMAGILLVGLLTFVVMAQVEVSALWGNGRWLAAAFIISCTAFGLALMAPMLLNFWRSRFALPWTLLAIAMALTPWLLPFPALAAPLLGLWLFAAALYLLLGLLAQFARHELSATAVADIGMFSERDRLVTGFNHFMAALFAAYEAVFGGRRLAAIQAEIVSAGPLDRDLSILQIAERARHALLLAVDRLDDLAGTPFTRKAGQAAYDSLAWLEAETVVRHVLSRTQWGAGLAQGFIRARDHRVELVRQADIFAGLDREGVQAVTAVMQSRTARKNNLLARAGDEATHFYLVDSGEVGVFHNGQLVATLHSGGYFGSGALAGQGRHQFSYRVLSTAVLFTIHRDDFDPLLRADTTLAQQVASGAQIRALLRRMSLFGSLSPQELAALEARLQRRRVAAGTVFVRQGEPRSALFIVFSGVVDVFVTEDGQEKVVGVLGTGEHFGEYALFADTPYWASCRARLDTELLLLDEAKFDQLVARCEQMTQYVEQVGSGRLLAAQRHTALPS